MENEKQRCRLCHGWIASGAWSLEQHKAHCNKTQPLPCSFGGKNGPCWLLLGAMLACACHGWVLFVDAMVGGLLLIAVVVRDSCRVPGAVAGCHRRPKHETGRKSPKNWKNIPKSFAPKFCGVNVVIAFFTF